MNNKRCGNCGKYPFCNKTNGTSHYCNEWIKRNIENSLKLKFEEKEGIEKNDNSKSR